MLGLLLPVERIAIPALATDGVGCTAAAAGAAGIIPKAFDVWATAWRDTAGVKAFICVPALATGAVADVPYVCAAVISGGTGACRTSGMVTMGTGM